MDVLRYYLSHSKYSDPGSQAHLFTDLPIAITEIANVVHGLIVHQDATKSLYGFELPKDRELEANTRYIEKILAIIIKRDGSPLSKKREPQNRFVGSCRDFALLTCSILRSKGIPARLRCGFASYFHDDWYPDHWVCEYWNREKKVWILVDSELGDEEKHYYSVNFDHTNVPRDQFMIAGEVWLGALSGKYNPEIYGVKAIDIKGLWFIRADVLRDLASLNKIELLPWDYTEYYDHSFKEISELSPADLQLTNNIAKITGGDAVSFDDSQRIYQGNSQVQVGLTITSYTKDGPKEVSLT
jgi:hypothetical protein